jgi:hypothetical protein
MTVLEITILKHTSSPTPELLTKTLSALQKVRSNLAAEVHPTHSRFFSPIDDPSLVYIFGSWPRLKSHRVFLENDELRSRVLEGQEGLMELVSGSHVNIGVDEVRLVAFAGKLVLGGSLCDFGLLLFFMLFGCVSHVIG